MLINISPSKYRLYFPQDPNPFVSEGFINLVKDKVDKVVRLIDSGKDVSIGLVAGVKNNALLAPFSAPFGGFHYKTEAVFYDRVYDFILNLKQYISIENIDSMKVTLSPNVYNPSLNSKLVNAFIRQGFIMETPDIISCMDLRHFHGEWRKNTVRQNCNKAIRSGLSFSKVKDEKSIKEVYDIIEKNRKSQDRNIYMSLQGIIDVSNVLQVDFFLVKNMKGESIGSGVFYRGHEKIVQGVFVGDVLSSRKLDTIDFLFLNVINFYKEKGFDFIDFGKSSSKGVPSTGLIRFKENHNCISTLGYTFSWNDVKS
ncbi:MAG: hypothetical protein GX921_04700 [Bacteroidales bacterium]|nr:hypothetical protein [Bacteroidales bacterium]